MVLQKGSTENFLMFYEFCLEIRQHVKVPLGIYSISDPQETPRVAACRLSIFAHGCISPVSE